MDIRSRTVAGSLAALLILATPAFAAGGRHAESTGSVEDAVETDRPAEAERRDAIAVQDPDSDRDDVRGDQRALGRTSDRPADSRTTRDSRAEITTPTEPVDDPVARDQVTAATAPDAPTEVDAVPDPRNRVDTAVDQSGDVDSVRKPVDERDRRPCRDARDRRCCPRPTEEHPDRCRDREHPPFDPRALLHRLINAQEWGLLVRLLHHLGLV